MTIYTIQQITDPDYGCEETRRPGPAALLKLCPDTGTGAEAGANANGRAEASADAGADGAIRKYVRVVTAIIRDSKRHPGKIFATARGYGEYKGWWEFPSGKRYHAFVIDFFSINCYHFSQEESVFSSKTEMPQAVASRI